MSNIKLLYGTTNKAKITVMENAVGDLGIELISLNDLYCELPVIVENGKTPLENAEIKARAYYEEFHIPVFFCDSGLYFDELSDEEQPGIHVRRVGGKELSDEEMTEIFKTNQDIKQIGKILIERALGRNAGYGDNITLILIEF